MEMLRVIQGLRSSILRASVCVVLLFAMAAFVPGPARGAPLAVVSFTATPAHIDDGQTSIFNVTVSGGTPPYGYNWSGLPPSQSWARCVAENLSEISCTAGVPGTFWVGVNITDAAGHAVAAGPVALTVADPIGFNAQAAPREGLVPLNVTFTNYGSGGTPPYTFQWVFGDGSQASVANTTHTYTEPGRYIVWGCVGDSLQSPMCEGLLVVVYAPLSVTLVAAPTNVTVGDPVYLYATASGGVSNWTYVWSSLPPGCLTENVSTLVCVPTTPGTYALRVTVSDGFGHSASTTVTLLVLPSSSPSPPFGSAVEWILAGLIVALSGGIVVLAVVVVRMRRTLRPPPSS